MNFHISSSSFICYILLPQQSRVISVIEIACLYVVFQIYIRSKYCLDLFAHTLEFLPESKKPTKQLVKLLLMHVTIYLCL